MNISKAEKKKLIIQLSDISQLIDEKAYRSAKRVIEDMMFDLDEIEHKYEDWRHGAKK